MSDLKLYIALCAVEVIVDGKAAMVAPNTPFAYDGEMDLVAAGAAREANDAEIALFEKNAAAKPEPKVKTKPELKGDAKGDSEASTSKRDNDI